MASISTRNITGTSFEARATGIDTGVTKSITWWIDGSEWYSETISTSSSRSSWVYFDDLRPGREYHIEAEIIYADGAYWDDIEEYVITLDDEAYEPDISGVYIQQRTADDPTTQIAVRVRGLDENYSESDWELYWYIAANGISVDEIEDTVPAGDDRSDTVTFAGLDPGTEYLIDLKIIYYVGGDKYIEWIDGVYISTDSEGFDFDSATMVAESSSDGTYIKAYVAGLDTNYGRDDRTVRWYLDDESQGDAALGPHVSQTDSYYFYNLTPGTQYKIGASIFFTEDGVISEKHVFTWCTTLNPRPDYFEWDYEKVQGEEIYITATEWNALQANINAVRAYKSYSNYSFTKASRGNKITAAMYNQCISAIDTINSRNLSSYKVTAGVTPLSAEAINNLRDFINEVE